MFSILQTITNLQTFYACRLDPKMYKNDIRFHELTKTNKRSDKAFRRCRGYGLLCHMCVSKKLPGGFVKKLPCMCQKNFKGVRTTDYCHKYVSKKLPSIFEKKLLELILSLVSYKIGKQNKKNKTKKNK